MHLGSARVSGYPLLEFVADGGARVKYEFAWNQKNQAVFFYFRYQSHKRNKPILKRSCWGLPVTKL